MKKGIIILFVFIVMLQPVFARAGGGSAGGGGGGGGSHSSHPHTSQRKNGSPFVGIVGTGACIAAFVYFKRRKARLMHQQIEDDLLEASNQDEFWDEKDLKRKVKDKYFVIQEAWSKQDLETLKKHLSEHLYERWQLKIEWQQYQNQSNLLDYIQLFKVMIVDLYDAIDNHQDYFWVYIEGKMKDVLMEDGQILESHQDSFVEYWKFIRQGNDILLDEIKQQEEVES